MLHSTPKSVRMRSYSFIHELVEHYGYCSPQRTDMYCASNVCEEVEYSLTYPTVFVSLDALCSQNIKKMNAN